MLLILTGATAVFILRLVRLRQLRSKYALLWLTIGVLMLPFAAFPGMLETLSDWVGVDYPPAMFLLLATGFLFLVVVHFSWELSRLESRTRTLAEEIALLRADFDAEHDEGRRSRSPR